MKPQEILMKALSFLAPQGIETSIFHPRIQKLAQLLDLDHLAFILFDKEQVDTQSTLKDFTINETLLLNQCKTFTEYFHLQKNSLSRFDFDLSADGNIHTFLGVTIRSSSDELLGVLYALDRNEFDPKPEIACIFNTYAQQFALELQYISNTKTLHQYQQDLELSHKKLNHAIRASGDAFWEWSIPEHQITFSDRWYVFLGIHSHHESLTFESFKKLCHPADLEGVLAAIFNPDVLANKQNYSIDFRVLHKDGEYRWISSRGCAVEWDVQGNATLITGINSDITIRKNHDDEIRESRRLFQDLFEFSPDPCLILDEGVYIECNQAAIDILGYSLKNQILNLQNSSISPPHQPNGTTSADSMEEQIRFALAFGVHRFEWCFKKVDGSIFPVEVTMAVMNLRNKDVLYCTWRDIQERKQSEAALREAYGRFEALIANTPTVAIQGVTRDGTTLHWNQASTDLYGYEANEVIGKPLHEFIYPHPEESLLFLKSIEEVWQSGQVRPVAEWEVAHRDGSIRYVLSSMVPIKSGIEVVEVFCIDVDISKRRYLEQELLELNADLENRVSERTLQLEEARSQAVQASAAKSQFLANMSHEIRTPMNAVIGLSHLLSRTELNKTQNDYLSKLKGAAQALLGILNDILDFSKIEAGKLDLELKDFDLEKVLSSVMDVVGFTAQTKDIEFICDMDPNVPHQVFGDGLRLNQILLNLAGNAVKFTHKGEVSIHVQLSQLIDEQIILHFIVRDTGIGLSQEQIDRIFTPFTQAESSTTRRYGGSGLGLTISKSLIEKMGGSLWVQSEIGKGSEFHFTAQFGLTPALEYLHKWSRIQVENSRILIVDDNATFRTTQAKALEVLGFIVHTAESGENALEIMNQNPEFDLLLVDWQMPLGMDGLNFIQLVRTHHPLISTKVILITAFEKEVVLHQVETLKIDLILTKPLSISTLLDSLQDLLYSRSQYNLRHQMIHQRSLNILVAEDNEINQLVIEELLTQLGHSVVVAQNGFEAYQWIVDGKDQYDLVLMDLQMPVMDGRQATRLIRSDERFKDLVILALTADAQKEILDDLIQSGVNDCLTKPVNPDELDMKINQWVNRS